MEFYSREDIAEQKEMRKRVKTAAIAVSAFAVLVCVILLIAVKPLNEKLFRIIAIVCAAIAGCFDIYVASFIMPYMRPKPKQRSAGGKVLHVLGNVLRQTHMYVIWILVSAVFVSFLFNLATDVRREKKVTIFAQVDSIREAELETVLAEDLPEGIKMIKAHTFSYSLFGVSELGEDDIYIVKASDIDQYAGNFAPLDEFLESAQAAEELAMMAAKNAFASDTGSVQQKPLDPYYSKDGQRLGIMIYYVPLYTSGAASEYIEYSAEEGGAMAYYLCFGKAGAHPGENGAAAQTARRLIQLR